MSDILFDELGVNIMVDIRYVLDYRPLCWLVIVDEMTIVE